METTSRSGLYLPIGTSTMAKQGSSSLPLARLRKFLCWALIVAVTWGITHLTQSDDGLALQLLCRMRRFATHKLTQDIVNKVGYNSEVHGQLVDQCARAGNRLAVSRPVLPQRLPGLRFVRPF